MPRLLQGTSDLRPLGVVGWRLKTCGSGWLLGRRVPEPCSMRPLSREDMLHEAFRARGCLGSREGSSIQHVRLLIPHVAEGIFGTRSLKYWVPGPSGKAMATSSYRFLPNRYLGRLWDMQGVLLSAKDTESPVQHPEEQVGHRSVQGIYSRNRNRSFGRHLHFEDLILRVRMYSESYPYTSATKGGGELLS